MPDEPQHELNNDEATTSQLVDWLASDVDGPIPEVDASPYRQTIARALCRRLGRDGMAWSRALERIASWSGGESVLESVLAECWKSIRDAFSAYLNKLLQRITYDEYGISGGLIHLILNLAPSNAERLRCLSIEELVFLREASKYDLNLLRYLLTWASVQPEHNEHGWRSEDRHPVASIWSFVAQEFLDIFTERSQDYYDNIRGFAWSESEGISFVWSKPEGASLARRMIDDIPSEQIVRNALEISTPLDLLVELSKLSPKAARLLGKDSRVFDQLIKETPRIDLTSSGTTTEIISPESKVYAALPFISRKNLDRQLLVVGWIIGSQIHKSDITRDADSVAQALGRRRSEVEYIRLCGIALLWADLRQLADYQHLGPWDHDKEIRGVLARLSEHLGSWPEAWAESAREILSQAKALGPEGTNLLTLAAVQHPAVQDVLKQLADHDREGAIRDRAAGVLARVVGLPTPSEDLRRWLADSAARAFDGIPLFPPPVSNR